MRGKNLPGKWIVIGMATVLLLAACTPKETPTPEPTLDFVATLTAEAPTIVPPTATFTALPSITATLEPIAISPTVELTVLPEIMYDEDGNPIENTVVQVDPIGYCYRLAILKTITSEDLDHLLPGQRFSVTWNVQNAGYCEWKPNFKAVWGLGEKIGNPLDILRNYVPAGGTATFSMEFKAPSTPGDYASYWHVINLDGYFFGEDLPVLVRVYDPNASPTPTPTKKPTKTPVP